jgi:hypothetical protein
MVLGEEGGILHESRQAYDKRVAGVVSGAGIYKPGIILGKEQSRSDRMPIAFTGQGLLQGGCDPRVLTASSDTDVTGDSEKSRSRPSAATKFNSPNLLYPREK